MTIDITDNSGLVREEFQAACIRALEKCGLTAEGYAKLLTPVDTGLLRNSITHAIAGEPPAISSYKADRPNSSGEVKTGNYSGSTPSADRPTAYIGTNVEYAAIQELGSSKQAAQPYLKPAVADHVSTYRTIIENELKG